MPLPKTKYHTRALTLIAWLHTALLFAQQVPDTSFRHPIEKPVYQKGKGPVVMVDEAHNNFHKLNERYYSFGKLLEDDGYVVKSNTDKFSKISLSNCKILVIANALHESDVQFWITPNPSAFTESEIEAVVEWVKKGGKLFLIADHMPFPGAASKLASEFGFKFNNGFAFNNNNQRVQIFSFDNHMLIDTKITRGRDQKEQVNAVATFTGQGFEIPDDAIPLLKFSSDFFSLMPDTAWRFHENTRKISLDGWSQGAIKPYGSGRVAVFGEAAMFTTQLAGHEKFKMGMNAEEAKQNAQFLLNIMHWLDGIID